MCILDFSGHSEVPSGCKKWFEILTVNLLYLSFNVISFVM